MTTNERCIVRAGIFDRWYIFHPHNILKAWSGSQWVSCCADGTPYLVQVCNFETRDEALDYCREQGLEPV